MSEPTSGVGEVWVVWVEQGYANYVGEPEAAFTSEDAADRYISKHVVSDDCRKEKVTLDPTSSDGARCSVEGCEFAALTSSPCCYGHTVDASDPRHIPSNLPTVDDLVGSDPGFTGGLEASEYVRRLRGYDASSDENRAATNTSTKKEGGK